MIEHHHRHPFKAKYILHSQIAAAIPAPQASPERSPLWCAPGEPCCGQGERVVQSRCWRGEAVLVLCPLPPPWYFGPWPRRRAGGSVTLLQPHGGRNAVGSMYQIPRRKNGRRFGAEPSHREPRTALAWPLVSVLPEGAGTRRGGNRGSACAPPGSAPSPPPLSVRGTIACRNEMPVRSGTAPAVLTRPALYFQHFKASVFTGQARLWPSPLPAMRGVWLPADFGPE